LQGDGGLRAPSRPINSRGCAWFLEKNVLLTGAAGNMALFYDAQIDIRAVRP
jgi:hypothetical protein